MNAPGPVIRLEVDHLKQAIITHLGADGSELDRYIRAEIDRQLERLNWPELVRVQLAGAVEHAVQQFFRRGPGYRAILEAITEQLQQALDHDET